MSAKLNPTDLHTLEAYAKLRPDFRRRVMEHKIHRKVALGDHVTLYFEDRLTMLYQVQEMLRVERIFEETGIKEELDAYNPLIPDGSNWKATMMIEYPDEGERRVALAKLQGIEDMVWVQAEGFERVAAIADEDMERSNEAKTSAVHFLRFELNASMIKALKAGVSLGVGVSHPEYSAAPLALDEGTRESLLADLD